VRLEGKGGRESPTRRSAPAVRAHWMLLASSERALSSTLAVTCLPDSAARASILRDG
jgi:hypothetical protein